jgi:pimeloyl-ACP methyl ester carboxylesterase
MTADRERLEIRDVTLTLRRAGTGPTLLYLHGFDGAPASGAVTDRLARDFRVLVPDHPGMGETDTPSWLDTIHDIAYFYLDFLKRLDLADVHLVGLDLGGWIALEIAVRSVERLRSLTLIGSAGIHLNGVPKGDLFMRAPDIVFRSLFADPAKADELLARQPTREEEDTLLKNRFTIARIGWHPPLSDPHLAKWLHRVKLPVQIIWGDTDRLFPIEYAHEFERLLSGSRLTVLPSCGHAAHIERPVVLATAIASFVKEHAR